MTQDTKSILQLKSLEFSNSEERMNVNIRDANHAGLFDIQRIIHYEYDPPKK